MAPFATTRVARRMPINSKRLALASLLATTVAATTVAATSVAASANAKAAQAITTQQGPTPSAVPSVPPTTRAPVPFVVGERLEYDVKFSALKVGNGSMEVREITDVRGIPCWHTMFRFSGGIAFYHVNDSYESWFDVATLTSRRYHQDIEEGNYKPKRRYEFYPERGMYTENDEPEQPTVASPLDDGSFLYFVRTIPLEVGKEYAFSRYFNPVANPVVIKVLRRETIQVPAGTFSTVVLQPTFKTKSLVFSENSRAEVWITDDIQRLMVQMKSKLTIGSINLYLRSVSSPRAP